MARRVVVTGMGVISPCGLDEPAFWNQLVTGCGGVRRIQAFDPAEFKSQNGAEVDSVALAAAIAARGWKAQERCVDMALLASAQALEQAGCMTPGTAPEPQPVATIFGTGFGPTYAASEAWQTAVLKGTRWVRPTTVPRIIVNAIPAQVSMQFRLTGSHYAVVAACSSSTIAIGQGFRMVRDGYADQVLCGGVDSLFVPAVYAAWNNLGAMSRNPDPTMAARPFDMARDGFVMGEGAGVVLLESLDSARLRGARVRGEVAGYGESSDAQHITRPSVAGQTVAMRNALTEAGVVPAQIAYINAHGTATKANDLTECESIRAVFGGDADRILVGSNKSFFGHTMGASGVLETAATLLALETGRIPPNLNLDHPDPACQVRLAGMVSEPLSGEYAMKNSFGFGGSNAVLILRRTG